MKCQAASLIALALTSATAMASLDNVTVKSSFPACGQVKIVEATLTPAQRMEYIVTRYSQNLQRMPKMEFLRGIADAKSIEGSRRLLQLISDQKIANIQAQAQRYAKAKTCLLVSNSGADSECVKVISDLKNTLVAAIPLLRRELALSVLPSTELRDFSSIPKTHINAQLRPIPGFANPAGSRELTPSEYQTAESDFLKDREIVRQDVAEQVSRMKSATLGIDEAVLRLELLEEGYRVQRFKHQANYTKILLVLPILAFMEKHTLNLGELPSSQDIYNGINRLFAAARTEIKFTQSTRDQKNLEFGRLDGEALWRGYVKGETELLQFITSPVANDVLQGHPEYCALAEQLLRRVSIKDLQNLAVSSLLFGIGPTAGLLGVGIRGGLMAARAVGLAESISVANSVRAGSNISLAIIITGNVVNGYRESQHQNFQDLVLPKSH
jgi:hypothetical protein